MIINLSCSLILKINILVVFLAFLARFIGLCLFVSLLERYIQLQLSCNVDCLNHKFYLCFVPVGISFFEEGFYLKLSNVFSLNLSSVRPLGYYNNGSQSGVRVPQGVREPSVGFPRAFSRISGFLIL